ncbi:hypothetical protein V6N13_124953 [Hibiscus sabdariffa]
MNKGFATRERRSEQRKPASAIQTHSAQASNGNGSRFDILSEDDGEALQVGDQGRTIPVRSLVASMAKETILLGNQMEEVPKEVLMGSLGAASIPVPEMSSVPIVTSTVPPHLSAESHIALTVHKEKVGKAKVHSISNRTSHAISKKGTEGRKGLHLKKLGSSKLPPRAVLSDWIEVNTRRLPPQLDPPRRKVVRAVDKENVSTSAGDIQVPTDMAVVENVAFELGD